MKNYTLFLVIPLAVSALTHLWNPVGFPYFHGDEGHYLRRSMHVLEGSGPQEQRNSTWTFERPYDHPYFGQLFLASIFGVINYPDILDPKVGAVGSMELLHAVPRIFMGLLAVADTFLVYKIAERRYNRTVAFIAAALFAVMPLSWLVRRILLDSILLPLVLLSILFAIYGKHKVTKRDHDASYDVSLEKKWDVNNLLSIVLSAIFLGLAVFTKIPAVSIIPLVGFLVYTNAGRSLKLLGLWFIPVFLVPIAWPAYAFSQGQFEEWLDGVSWQAQRSNSDVLDSLINDISKRTDPILFYLGVAGFVYGGTIKRDLLVILWIIPYVIFFFFVGNIRINYWIPTIPIFCIAAAILITDLSSKINRKNIWKILPFAIISAIGIHGLFNLAVLAGPNYNSTFFEAYAFIVDHLPDFSNDTISNNEKRTIMGSNWMQTFSWIPQYVFDKNHDFKTFLREKSLPIMNNEKVLLIVDNKDLEQFILTENSSKNFKQKQVYNNTQSIAKFKDKAIHTDPNQYPRIDRYQHPELKKGIEIRTNY